MGSGHHRAERKGSARGSGSLARRGGGPPGTRSRAPRRSGGCAWEAWGACPSPVPPSGRPAPLPWCRVPSPPARPHALAPPSAPPGPHSAHSAPLADRGRAGLGWAGPRGQVRGARPAASSPRAPPAALAVRRRRSSGRLLPLRALGSARLVGDGVPARAPRPPCSAEPAGEGAPAGP